MNNSINKMNHFIEKYYWFLFAGLAAFAAMLCFLRLDVAYVASWDEARHLVFMELCLDLVSLDIL